MFTLNDLNLEYFDGYIYAGVTPSFTPHADPPQPDIHEQFMLGYGTTDYPHPPGQMNGAVDDRAFYQGNEFRFINQ